MNKNMKYAMNKNIKYAYINTFFFFKYFALLWKTTTHLVENMLVPLHNGEKVKYSYLILERPTSGCIHTSMYILIWHLMVKL